MKYRTILALLALSAAACGSNNENNGTNNGSPTNNGSNNGSATNNGSNNGSATNNGSNNGTANNGSNTSNNGTPNTNNGTPTTNNGTTPGPDFISADVDGAPVVADADEGGVEPMGNVVQLRKTTTQTAPGQTFRLTVPNTDPASYDCATDDVTVEYIRTDGQLADIFVAADTCTIEITEGGSAAGDLVVGTFTASATNGVMTVELTNGAFRLTR